MFHIYLSSSYLTFAGVSGLPRESELLVRSGTGAVAALELVDETELWAGEAFEQGGSDGEEDEMGDVSTTAGLAAAVELSAAAENAAELETAEELTSTAGCNIKYAWLP